LHARLLHSAIGSLLFLRTDISQGSVVMRLGCGGIFNYHFASNSLLNLTVKVWKSVSI